MADIKSGQDVTALMAGIKSGDDVTSLMGADVGSSTTVQEPPRGHDFKVLGVSIHVPPDENPRLDSNVAGWGQDGAGIAPEDVLMGGLAAKSIAKATSAGGMIAGLKEAVKNADPIVKYEVSRRALRAVGVPDGVAEILAAGVVGYRPGGKRAIEVPKPSVPDSPHLDLSQRVPAGGLTQQQIGERLAAARAQGMTAPQVDPRMAQRPTPSVVPAIVPSTRPSIIPESRRLSAGQQAIVTPPPADASFVRGIDARPDVVTTTPRQAQAPVQPVRPTATGTSMQPAQMPPPRAAAPVPEGPPEPSMAKPAAEPFNPPRVKSPQQTLNEEAIARRRAAYQASQQPAYTKEVVHITTPEAAKGIKDTGFDVNRGQGLGGDKYGPGVYLADKQSDMGGYWRSQLETKNPTGIVPTESMSGDVKLSRPFVYEYNKYGSGATVTGRISPREALGAKRPDLLQKYDALMKEGKSANEALGEVVRSSGYDGLVIKHRAGDEIVAFDAKSVKFSEPSPKDYDPAAELARILGTPSDAERTFPPNKAGLPTKPPTARKARGRVADLADMK